jgi:hypothetical protein
MAPYGLRVPERIHALKGPGIDAPLPAGEAPYRGLLAFEPDDRRFFFGREEVVDEVLARLAPGRTLAIVGASGSGKSSVLRAGVVGAVLAGEVEGVEGARILTPGAEPRLEVAGDQRELVVVDQFEELYTLCEDPARRVAHAAIWAASGVSRPGSINASAFSIPMRESTSGPQWRSTQPGMPMSADTLPRRYFRSSIRFSPP